MFPKSTDGHMATSSIHSCSSISHGAIKALGSLAMYNTSNIARFIFFFWREVKSSLSPLVQFLPNKMVLAWVSNEGAVTNQ